MGLIHFNAPDARQNGHWLWPILRQGVVAQPDPSLGETRYRATVRSAVLRNAGGQAGYRLTGSGGHLAQPSVADASAWTMLSYGVKEAAAAEAAVCTIAESPGSATVDRSLAVNAAGTVYAAIFDGANRVATTTSALSVGVPTLIAATSSGLSVTAYVLGNAVSTAASNSGYAAYVSPEFVVGYGNMLGSTRNSDWTSIYTLLLTQAVSRARLDELAADPAAPFRPRRIWVPVTAASGSTGTSATTNANDTSAASGSPVAVGSSATTNADDTSSASGTVGGGSGVSGTAATTNADDTSTASGTTTVTGTSATTNAADTSTASGTTTVTGTSATTNANDTATASGVAGSITGTSATTNANDVASASGSGGPTPEPSASTGAGRSKRRQQRPVVVEIDGEDFVVNSEAEAIALLDKAKEQAEQLAEVQIARAAKAERRKTGKVIADARKTLVVPQIKAPGLESYAAQVLADIRDTYASTMRTIEVAALLRKRDREEEDDEDVLLLLI